MKNIIKVAIVIFLACSSSLYADLYDEMVLVIKESDCERVKEIVQLTSFPEHEQKIFLNLANEVISERKLKREHRKYQVMISLALKAFSPFISRWAVLPGICLDPRGVPATFAILPLIFSPLVLATLAIPFVEDIRDRELTIGISLLGAFAAATAYGLLSLEKHLWKRSAAIDLALDQAIEKASDCKSLLIKLFGTQQIDLL